MPEKVWLLSKILKKQWPTPRVFQPSPPRLEQLPCSTHVADQLHHWELQPSPLGIATIATLERFVVYH